MRRYDYESYRAPQNAPHVPEEEEKEEEDVHVISDAQSVACEFRVRYYVMTGVDVMEIADS